MIEPKFVPVRPPFKASAERKRLVERMLEMEVGEMISYPEIEKLIGEKAQSQRGLGIIRRAKESVRKRHRLVFVNIPNQGIKRLEDEEIVEHVSSTILVSVRRKVRVGSEELECVSYTELPMDRKIDYQLSKALTGYIGSLVHSRAMKNSKAVLRSHPEAADPGNVLKLFQRPETKTG